MDRFKIPLVATRRGFSLLEIIATLVLVGISAAILYPALRTNLVRSAEPVNRLSGHQLLIQEMDKWTAVYRNEIENDTLDITSFKADIDSNANYLDNTLYINSFNSGAYTTQGTNKILRVTLVNDDQTLVALFAE